MRRLGVSLLICAALASPRVATAQETNLGYEVNYGVDGAITGIALVGALGFSFIPVDKDKRWDGEIFGGFDKKLRTNFSMSASKMSDMVIGMTMATPVFLQFDRGFNEEAGKRLLLYTESLSLALLANAAVKYTVQRPRPYNYNTDERVKAFAEDAGKDSHTSFYSGHATLAFTAAVAGSYLFSVGSDDDNVKAAVWFVELTLATTTANLRVRAGKHFYSDILLGALTGVAFGYLVPALHADDAGVYKPSGVELGAMAGGIVVGGLVSQLLPLKNDITIPLGGGETQTARSLRLVPMALDSGAGFALAGSLD